MNTQKREFLETFWLELDELKEQDNKPKGEYRVIAQELLNNAPMYDLHARLPKEYIPKVIHYIDNVLMMDTRVNRDTKIEETSCLFANLIHGNPVMIPLDKNFWSKSKFETKSLYTIKLVKAMAEMIELRLLMGFNDKEDPSNNRISRIWATEKFLREFPETLIRIRHEYKQVVELYKKDKKGKLERIDYKETKRTIRMDKILRGLNKINEETNWNVQDTMTGDVYGVGTSLRAIFHNNFNSYGRLHSKGHRHFQGISGELRCSGMYIDNKKTVELDFKGLHPNILYAYEGIQFTGDPYSIVHPEPLIRPLLKNILLFSLNAENKTKARQAVQGWVNKQGKEYARIMRECGITSVVDIMTKMEYAHKPIVHHFYSQSKKALDVFRKDSEIALEVIYHFVKQGIPILPIHDSFIVERKYEDELKGVMKEMFAKLNNGMEIEVTRE